MRSQSLTQPNRGSFVFSNRIQSCLWMAESGCEKNSWLKQTKLKLKLCYMEFHHFHYVVKSGVSFYYFDSKQHCHNALIPSPASTGNFGWKLVRYRWGSCKVHIISVFLCANIQRAFMHFIIIIRIGFPWVWSVSVCMQQKNLKNLKNWHAISLCGGKEVLRHTR